MCNKNKVRYVVKVLFKTNHNVYFRKRVLPYVPSTEEELELRLEMIQHLVNKHGDSDVG